MTVASPVFDRTSINYKDVDYPFEGSRHLDYPSLHLCGLKDQMFPLMTCHQLFTESSKPRRLLYDEGHKFPRSLSDENQRILCDFIQEQFWAKFESKHQHDFP